jgi:ribosomal-protein-alanine N-acetyltransferase
MSAVLKRQNRDDRRDEAQPRIEPMQERDLPAVLEIERRIYEFPWTLGNFLDSLRAGYSCWVFRGEAGVIGYAIIAVAAGEAHLLNLSIDASHQRQGRGGALLAHVISVVREHRGTMLFLEVRPSNEGGRGLYRKFAFKRIGVRRDYYPAASGREDAWVLALIL